MNLERPKGNRGIGEVDWLARAIEFILAAILFFAPLAFGTVNPWSEQVVLVLAGVMAVLFFVRLLLNPNASIYWHGSYVLTILFVFIVGLQLIVLPSDLVRLLSPHTVNIKTDLLSGLAMSNLDLSAITLSFYPNATAHDLRLVLSIATVFFVVLNLFTSLASIKRLLSYITLVGCAVALLAILQFITQTDKIYWIVPIPPHTLAYGGPFVNHSNFAQFMNLSIGAGIGLILIRIRELSPDFWEDASKLKFIHSSEAKPLLLLGLTSALGAAAVFLSLSRGGIISLLLAGGFITVLIALSSRQKGRGQIIAIIALASFACVLYIGFDTVYERMATLHDLADAEGGRLDILRDLTQAWGRFPLFGTGLGTHSVVYPMFNTSTISALAGHAENEYAQILEETGIVGLIIVCLFITFVCKAFVRSIQNKHNTVNWAAYGLGFGLLAVIIHSLSDFGQHLPANAFLSAIFCALLLRMEQGSFQYDPKTRSVPDFPLPIKKIVAIIGLIVTASGWGVIIFQANKARCAEAFWTRAIDMETYFDEIAWQGTNLQYVELLKNAKSACDNQPGNVHYRHWLNVYRWRSISRLTDPNTGEVILTSKSIQAVQRIVDEFKKACIICPTFGPTYCVMGQLQAMVLGDPNGLQQIETGYRLAPCDPTACFIAGTMEAQQGEYESAFIKLERAVQLNDNYFPDAALVCLESMNEPNNVLALAGDNISMLNRAATLLSTYGRKDNELSEEFFAGVDYAIAKVQRLLEERSRQADAPADIFAALGAVHWRNQELDRAVDAFRKALMKDYGQVYWRYKLARVLAEQGRMDEAMHEAKICLRLNSEFSAAKQLIEELAVKVSEAEVAKQ